VTGLIRAVVVAPVRLYREGLVQALARDLRVTVVGAAASASEASALVEQRRPDTVVLDLGAAGPSFVRDLTAVAPELRVIALAVMETPSNLVEWAKAGIAGLVGEDGTVSDLVETIVSASRDELRCSPWAAGVLLREVRAGAIHTNGDTFLTPREVEIAQLIERGLMNKEIASQLGIELPTVKNHVHRILEKLGAHRRADAAAHIRHAGLSLRD
jgi:two-component system, NarL family, nitrate/nitrite response regulator NarL